MGKSSNQITNLAFGILGAHRTLRPKHIRQLELSGVSAAEMKPLLKSIRSLSGWEKVWCRRGDELLNEAEKTPQNPTESGKRYRAAAASFYMASILHMPKHPKRQPLTEKMVRAYHAWGKITNQFEQRILQCKEHNIYCNVYHPTPGTPAPLVIMVPPLGSVKEQIDFQVQPFLAAGYVCVTLDLPGVGQTGGVMPLDAQFILSEVISQLQADPDILPDKIAMMGLSLGAYWSMKTAAIDSRIKLAIGVSAPAVSGKYWNAIPKHYWDYFQIAFGTPNLQSTRHTTEQLSLFHVMDQIKCPVLLFHGNKDNVSQPGTMDLFYQETKHAPLTTRIYPRSGHSCLDEIKRDVLPFALQWCTDNIG